MNGCEKYEALISALLDNELSVNDKSELAEHLKVCPDCAALYDAFSSISNELQGELEEMPEILHENIMAEIRRTAVKKKNQKLSKPLKTLIATAACAVLVIGGAFLAAPARSAAPVVLSSAAEDRVLPESPEAPNSTYEAEYRSAMPSAETFSIPAPVEGSGAVDAADTAEAEAAPENGNAGTFKVKSAGSAAAAAEEEPVIYELDKDSWDSFCRFISASSKAVAVNDLPPVSITVALEGSADASYIDIYLIDTETIYFDSCSQNFYRTEISSDDIASFLEF